MNTKLIRSTPQGHTAARYIHQVVELFKDEIEHVWNVRSPGMVVPKAVTSLSLRSKFGLGGVKLCV